MKALLWTLFVLYVIGWLVSLNHIATRRYPHHSTVTQGEDVTVFVLITFILVWVGIHLFIL